MRTRRSIRWTVTRSAPVGVAGGGGGLGRAGDAADLSSRNDAAVEHLVEERWSRALTTLEALLGDCRWRLGHEHPETLVVEGNLAVAQVVAGQEEAGTHLMLANLAARERVFGDEHPQTLTARDAVATTHRLAGRLREALWLYSRVAPQRNRVLGPAHPDTLTTRLGLGLTFAATGDTAMALDVVTAALEDCERVGAAHEHAEMLRGCLAELRATEAPAAGVRAATVGSLAPFVPRQRDPARTVPEPVVLRRGRDGLLVVDTGSGAPPGGGP
jgi:hypothetical protein